MCEVDYDPDHISTYVRAENNNQHTKMKIIEPEDVDFTKDDYLIVPKGQRYILVHKDKPTVGIKPTMTCKGCTVKYTPAKYSKITIQLNQYDAAFFMDFDIKIGNVVQIEDFMKDEAISLKICDEQKKELEDVKKDAFCDVVFKFNDIWKVNGKWFASFVLEEFQLRAKPKYFGIQKFRD
jgi:hypothetical protein